MQPVYHLSASSISFLLPISLDSAGFNFHCFNLSDSRDLKRRNCSSRLVENHHRLDNRAAVPRAIEQDELAAGRQMIDVTLISSNLKRLRV